MSCIKKKLKLNLIIPLQVILFFLSFQKLYCQADLPVFSSTSVNLFFNNKPLGSGFFLNKDSNVYLVTAAHVLYKKDKNGKITDNLQYNQIQARVYASKDFLNNQSYLKIILNDTIVKKHQDKDICILKISSNKPTDSDGKTMTTVLPYVNVINHKGDINAISPHQIISKDSLLLGEEVRIVGYPSYLDLKNWGGGDVYNFSHPLVQHGIISGTNKDIDNIIISGSVYYGNSGGPVFYRTTSPYIRNNRLGLEKKYQLIGIVSSFIPFQFPKIKRPKNLYDYDSSNSGYSVVIPVKYALEIVEEY